MRPGVALFFFWLCISFLILISGHEVRPESFFAQLSFWLAAVVVPYTVYFGAMLFFNIDDVRWEWRRLGAFSIFVRIGIALLLSVFFLLSIGLSGRSDSLNRRTIIFFKEVEFGLGYLEEDSYLWLLEQLPEGEVELSKLPKVILDQYFPGREEERLDQWGRPYMFVTELQNDKFWMGIYSKGQDGVSVSKGNDPDDISTWSQSGFEFYGSQEKLRNRQRAFEVRERFFVALAFFMPICFVSFRWPYFPEDQSVSSY